MWIRERSGMKGCIYNAKTRKIVYWLDETDWNFSKKPKTISVRTRFEMHEYDVLICRNNNDLNKVRKGQYIKWREYKGKITSITGTELKINWINDISSYLNNLFEAELAGLDIIDIELGANLDGLDGEVMVYVPGFFIKSFDREDECEVRISLNYIDDTWGYQPSIMVSAYKNTILGNVPSNMGYLSTLEQNSAISVVNWGQYCKGGGNNFSLTLSANAIFEDVLNKCKTNVTRSEFRTFARKGGKEIISYAQYRNIMYWLYVIEYANFNVQEPFNPNLNSFGFRQGGLGMGMTTIRDWNGYNSYNPIVPNGFTNDLGNGTGVKPIEPVTPKDIQYLQNLTATRWRGIEDPFGHVWSNLDGIICVNSPNPEGGPRIDKIYITTNPTEYKDTAGNLLQLHFIGDILSVSGWIKDWAVGDQGNLIPIIHNDPSNGTTFKCDYCETSSLPYMKAFLIGGSAAAFSEKAGLGHILVGNKYDYKHASVGFRTVVELESV